MKPDCDRAASSVCRKPRKTDSPAEHSPWITRRQDLRGGLRWVAPRNSLTTIRRSFLNTEDRPSPFIGWQQKQSDVSGILKGPRSSFFTIQVPIAFRGCKRHRAGKKCGVTLISTGGASSRRYNRSRSSRTATIPELLNPGFNLATYCREFIIEVKV